MRDQLIQYVSLLFAGQENCADIRQEILQNTLDRYDDMISQGKSPEAAYRLAISGIGDINEILEGRNPLVPAVQENTLPEVSGRDHLGKKLLRAIAVGLYILSPLPLIALCEMEMEVFGLCGTLCFIAVATVMIILGGKKSGGNDDSHEENEEPKSELGKSISGLIWAIGLAAYLLISFLTGAWHITWVLFPILAAVKTLVCALIPAENPPVPARNSRLKKGIERMIWAIGLALYFVISFATMAWYITWLIFPITTAAIGLVRAIMDILEGNPYEN